MSSNPHGALAHNSVWTAVFGNPDLLDKIVTHVTFKILAATVLQLNRAFCNSAQQRLRCALRLLAPPLRMQPRQILESTVLHLAQTQLGDDGVSALAGAYASGALPKLEALYLTENTIGDAGMEAFASACASGAMAQLQVSSLPTALESCLEIWHVCSPHLTVSFDVSYVPCAEAYLR